MDLPKMLNDCFSESNRYPVEYESMLRSASDIDHSPNKSRNLGDLITLLCARTNSVGIYSLFYASLLHSNVLLTSFSYNADFLTEAHTHNYIEIGYILEGQLKLQIGNKMESFQAGELFQLDKDCKHSDLIEKENSSVLYLGIADYFFDKSIMKDYDFYNVEKYIRDIIEERKEKYQFVRFTPKVEKPEIYDLFGFIFQELRFPRVGTVSLVKGYVERLVSLLFTECQISLTQKERGELQQLLFEDIKVFIKDNFQHISIDMLVKKFGYNEDYFNRLIKKFAHISYTETVRNIRMEKADDLLQSTTLSIEKIAHMIGYNNLGFFYRIFQECHRMSPKEFRNKYSDRQDGNRIG